MATPGDRAWYAYHCLPRQRGGKPPTIKSLADKHKANASAFTRLFTNERTGLRGTTATKVAAALGVTVEWIMDGVGDAPTLTGEIPPRPGAEDVPAWRPEGFDAPRQDVEIPPLLYASLQELYDLTSDKVHPKIWQTLAKQRFGQDPGNAHWTSEVLRMQEARAAVIKAVRPIDDSALDHVPGPKRRR